MVSTIRSVGATGFLVRRLQMSDENSSVESADAVVAAASDGIYTLVVADFADPNSALEAYEAMKSVENGETVEIEGVLVVKRDGDGPLEVQEVTDHSTKSGLKWGAVGGVVLGVLFPPSIIASAVVLGAAGAGTGKLRELYHHDELEDELQGAIDPGHSGIVAIVSDPSAVKVAKALDLADRIVQHAVDKAAVADMKAAAKAAESSS
jgi:uncharacterized membrane protein